MFESVMVGGGGRGGVLVVGHFQGEGLDRRTKELDPDGSLAAAAGRGEATGDAGRVVEAFPSGKKAPTRILLVGLGPKAKFGAGELRNIAAAVGRRLAQAKETGAAIELGGPLGATRTDAERAGSAFGEGIGLLSWSREQFKGSAANGTKRAKLSLRSTDTGFAEGMERGLGLGESANVARTLSETPPNICTPGYVAAEAQKLARKTGMSCTVFKGPALQRERLTGLINVGQASENKPCMVRLEYTPGARGGRTTKHRSETGATRKGGGKPIVLVGKTMTYDSGGLSLKINNSMRGMKRDKDGGCAVLGAMHAIATVVRPRKRVVALLVAAENSISDEAYRPDDIITYRNGVTVEVTNTDAEGRLVLADGLCWACDEENPACIIDLATLTGGVVTALGSTFAGMWCEDDALRRRIEAASEASGERVWRLPHHQEYRDMMKSDVADIINSNPNRKAHPIQGAAFLAYFVKEGIPWCHLDIAGVHAVEGDTGPFIKNSCTGWGVRLLAEFMDGA